MKKRQKPKSVESMLRSSAKKGFLNPYSAGVEYKDPGCIQRCTAVLKGEAPSYVTEVRFDSLLVDHQPTLDQTRRAVLENPSMLKPFRHFRQSPETTLIWPVFRNAEGHLVMFDNYNDYVCAEIDGVETIRVQVLGETAPLSDPEAENCPSGWMAPVVVISNQTMQALFAGVA